MESVDYQIMGASPESAILTSKELLEREQRRLSLNGADMEVMGKPPTSEIPEFVLIRSGVIIKSVPRINNSVNMIITKQRVRRGGMGY